MKYAIVESGGKQYKAVEGEPIEVDRLPVDAGEKVGLERVLMVVDGDDISVGTPTVDGIKVNTTVMDHIKGPKIIVFKYSPRKRYRVKGGHRQQYTRLMVDAIGTDGKAKASKSKKSEEAPAEKKAEAKAEKKEATAKSAPKEKKAEKAPAKKEPAKKTKKAPAKKTTTKKNTSTSSPKEKKSSSTKKTEK